MSNLTTNVIEKANGAANSFKGSMQSAEGQFEKLSHDAGKAIGAVAASIADTSSEYVATGRNYVKANPVQSMAMAAAAGLITGSLATLILRRRQ